MPETSIMLAIIQLMKVMELPLLMNLIWMCLSVLIMGRAPGEELAVPVI